MGSVKGVFIFDIVEILRGVEFSLGLIHFQFFEILPELRNTTPTLVCPGLMDFVGDNSHDSRGNCSFSKLLFPNVEVTLVVVGSWFNFCFLTLLPLLVCVFLFPFDKLFFVLSLSLLLLLSFADVLRTLLDFIGGVVIGVLEYL